MIFQLGRSPNRITILTDVDGVSFDDAWARRSVVQFDGLGMPFIGRDDLLANKRASGRPQDLADARRLEKLPPR